MPAVNETLLELVNNDYMDENADHIWKRDLVKRALGPVSAPAWGKTSPKLERLALRTGVSAMQMTVTGANSVL